MVLFAKFRRLIRVLKKYTLKFIFRPWKGVGAGFGCRILFGFAAFNDKFHAALLSDRLLLVFSSPKNLLVFWETLSKIGVVMGRQRQRQRRRDMG
jgi:hypothetical protein